MKRGFFVLLLFLISCGGNESVPSGILPPEEMVKVLDEIYVIESKVNRLSLKNDSSIQVFNAMKEKVFNKVGISDSVFKKSINYYMDHPKEMELVYTALVDSLNLKEQRSSVRPDQQQ
jgi:hypothetical protein